MTKKKNLLLPNDLIVQILLKLSIKSILRLKCVCKSWNSLISDPQFARSHLNLASNGPINDRLFYVVARSGSEARWLDFRSSIKYDCAVVPSPLPYSPYDRNLTIRGSCRGFILLESYPNLVLWNPATGAKKRLSCPPSASIFLKKIFGVTTRNGLLWYGFGYDSSRDDYLVVIGWNGCYATNLKTHFEVYSLRTNSWKEIEGTDNFCYHVVGDRTGFLFNGVVHWLAYRGDFVLANVIIAFDLKARNLSTIPAPKALSYNYNLMVVEGCLGGWCWGIPEIEIWVMKEYKMQSSWAKKTVAFPPDTSEFSPLCFTEGGELVARNNSGHLVKFNDKGKLVQLRPGYHDRSVITMYTETLLSFPGDFGEAKEDDHY